MVKRFITRLRLITKGTKRGAAIFCVLASAFCVFFLTTSAGFAMEVRPPIVQMSAKPGAATTTVFLLKNSEAAPETYIFTIQGFLPAGDDGRQVFLPVSETAGLPSWLSISQSKVTLKPGESIPVLITFQPPEQATPGAYQAVVFANQVDSRGAGGVTLGSRVGVLVFATVNGEAMRALSVRSFLRNEEVFARQLPISFEIKVRNEGNTHEMVGGHVRITDVFGRAVALLPFGDRAVRVVPRSERRMTAVWGEERSREQHFFRQLRSEWSPFAFGWYRAYPVFDQVGVVNRLSDISFFVLPWRTLVLIVGLGVGMTVMYRRRV